jgi:leucyl-tRNA synthetase
LSKEVIKYVIQINGKTREIIKEKNNLTRENLIELIMENKKLYKYIQNKSQIKKVIFIQNKLINIIV